MRFSLLAIVFLLGGFMGGLLSHAAAADLTEIQPPRQDFRHIERSVEGAQRFDLIRSSKPAFHVAVSDPQNLILRTAAADFARYFQARWDAGPAVETLGVTTKSPATNLIVLASVDSLDKLPTALRAVAAENRDLKPQAFVIQRIPLPDHRIALLCLGGAPIGARYASVEILRRMIYTRRDAYVKFNRIRDQPYFSWRAAYINDSAHQANNYDPNLVYPVATYRWPMAKWKRYIDQMAFFRYNVLEIWLVPEMFTPKALKGGGVYDYVRDTINAVARYARARGIEVEMLNGINVSVDRGRLLNTVSPVYKNMPVYRYLSPNKPKQKALMFALWNHWSKALSEVDLWSLFPGDPGGCAEQGCGPDTYVDLSIQISHIIRENNPKATIDICPWQFFGWGPTWPTELRKDTARVDRGYRYLVSKVGAFPPNTVFSPNLNDFTSEPPIRGAAGRGGNTIQYIDAIHRQGHLLHTWTYFVTGGEGWLNHHDKVAAIIKQRRIEAKYPESGGICYTMTPSLNLLNQYACAEAFWNPHVTVDQVMQSFTDGVFGTSEPKLIGIFPSLDQGPIVGYTFAKPPTWNPDFSQIHAQMTSDLDVLHSLPFNRPTRFDLVIPAREYASELAYFANFYKQMSSLGEAVSEARRLVRQSPRFEHVPADQIDMAQARQALSEQTGESKKQLQQTLDRIQAMNVPAMKQAYRAKHYEIFLDYPTPFTKELPILIDGLFNAFGAGFVE